MAIQRFNAVGGFSTGLTLTNVIDSTGNITAVGATFSGLIRANAGISAAGGVTLAGTLQGTTANFTGLVSSTIGFSGPATNLTNVAKLNTSNTFTSGSYLTVTGVGMFAGRVQVTGNSIIFTEGYDDGSTTLLGSPYTGLANTVTLPPTTGTIALTNSTVASFNGLTGAVTGVTVGGTNVFTALNSFNAGISASGITVGGSIVLQNQEFIRNTTNGRMDFMPAPAGSTQFGMYMDFTSWSYGVKLGTIRASDNATNAAGFLWEAPLTISTNVPFNLGSDGQNGFLNSSVGNRTNQFFTNTTSGQNSGAFAFVDAAGYGQANRSPGVTHTNPNLYVYRSGSARANDFIRFEHDGSTGYIISGGTSDIKLMPGSGIVGVSGNIQVLQNQIYVTNNARSWFL